MSHRKPLGLGLLIGLLAMAFAALPAMAGAAQLTENGSPVEEGATVSATSTNAVTSLLGGAVVIDCEHVEVNGILTTNSGGEVVIAMHEEEVDTATGCTLNGEPIEISPTLEGIALSGNTGTADFSFQAGSFTESSHSTVSWVGPDALTAHVEGTVSGSAPGTFSGDFSFSHQGEALTLD